MFYGAMVWDPWLIVSQIVCLQCLYYLSLGVAMALLVGTRVPRLTLLYLFDFATLTPRTPTGWCAIASFLLAAVAGAGFMLYVIERAKKCLDFAATLYIIHLFICIVYGGWPASITWWVVNIAGLAIMALLGEYLCIRRELKEIPISRFRARRPHHRFSSPSVLPVLRGGFFEAGAGGRTCDRPPAELTSRRDLLTPVTERDHVCGPVTMNYNYSEAPEFPRDEVHVDPDIFDAADYPASIDTAEELAYDREVLDEAYTWQHRDYEPGESFESDRS